MSGGYAVGIDLGTSNTVAILRFPDGRTRPVLFDGQPILPSAVFLDHDGTLRVGRDAQRMAQLDPARYEPNPKRRIDEDVLFLGDRELPIVDVLAAPLRTVARAVTDTVGHLPPAVITCPAAWGTARKGRLQQAATRAGWPPVHLMAEPIAAARYFTETQRRPIPVGQTLAIFDFGGGTLDVALVRNDGATFTVIGSGGAEDLGGLDIDAAIVNHLGQLLAVQHPHVWAQIDQPADELARRNRRMFWEDVRAAKEMLSRSTAAPVAVPGVSASLHVTRDELEQLATPLLRRATGELSRALRQANLMPGHLCGIFLVGGTSRVPLVSRLLHAETGIAPTVLEQPELPVAEGAVAGGPAAPAQRAAPAAASRSPAVPVSGTPVSGMPVSGTPVSGSPTSGSPSSGAPAHAPRPYTTVAPPMPPPMPPVGPTPHPMAGMWVAPGPPPRPPRRYRAWPWLLAVLLVFGGLCYSGYLVVKANATDSLTAERTITIDDMTPAGLRQAFVTSGWAHAVGQRVDGTVEVASVKHGTDATVRHRSTKGGPWIAAFQIGNWVAVLSAPAADGTCTLLVSNAADDAFAETAVAASERVTFTGADPGGGLGYIAYSEAANTVRYGVVGGPAPKPGQPVPLPAGTRPLPGEQGDDHVDFIDGAGKVLRYSRIGMKQNLGQAAPGHPATLVHYDARNGLYVAENKTGYQLLRSGTRIYMDQSIRRPLWIGPCGDRVCMIDEAPDDPTSRQVFEVTPAGASDARAPVPYAVVPASLVRAAEFVVVPTAENDKVGSVVADLDRGTYKRHAFDVRLRDEPRLGGVDAVLIPTRPAGSAPEWAGTAQSLTIDGVDFADGITVELGTVTAVPATCDVGGSRLACSTGTAFTVWKIDS